MPNDLLPRFQEKLVKPTTTEKFRQTSKGPTARTMQTDRKSMASKPEKFRQNRRTPKKFREINALCWTSAHTTQPISSPRDRSPSLPRIPTDPSVHETSSLNPKIFSSIRRTTTLKSILPMLESTHCTWTFKTDDTF